MKVMSLNSLYHFLQLSDSYYTIIELFFRFRFDRPNLHKVLELVKPFLDLGDSNRGLPISAELIVCSALEMMAGGHFYRVGGYTSGTALSTAWKNMKR